MTGVPAVLTAYDPVAVEAVPVEVTAYEPVAVTGVPAVRAASGIITETEANPLFLPDRTNPHAFGSASAAGAAHPASSTLKDAYFLKKVTT